MFFYEVDIWPMLEKSLLSNLLRFLKCNIRSLPHYYHVRFNKQLQSLNLDSLDSLGALRLIREVQILKRDWTWNVSLRIFLVFAELFTSIVWLIHLLRDSSQFRIINGMYSKWDS